MGHNINDHSWTRWDYAHWIGGAKAAVSSHLASVLPIKYQKNQLEAPRRGKCGLLSNKTKASCVPWRDCVLTEAHNSNLLVTGSANQREALNSDLNWLKEAWAELLSDAFSKGLRTSNFSLPHCRSGFLNECSECGNSKYHMDSRGV